MFNLFDQRFLLHQRGMPLVYTIAVVSALGFTLFGYDQGVMGGLITEEQFLATFPETNDPSVQGITVSIYEIGCLFGAIFNIFYGDVLGRKRSIALGMFIMTIGAVILTTSYGLPQFIVGRIVSGLGNGINTSVIPTYQSECAPARIRGALVLISGASITFGIMTAYWASFGAWFTDSSFQWRGPISFQMVFSIIILFALIFVPESPRWLVKVGRTEEARPILARLENLEEDSPELEAIISTLEISVAETAAFSFKDLFTGGPLQNFRRATLGFVAQAFQQLSGINLISYYAAYIYENSIGLSPFLSRLLAALNGTEYFMASIVAIPLIDRLGRRFVMIWGCVGMGLTMVLLTIMVHFADSNSACGIVAAVLLFVYNSFFAIGWLGSTWLYAPEVTNINIRSQASSLSTVSNWLFNFLIVMITPPAFTSIGEYTYTLFAVINLALILPVVYLFFPETAGRSLEEMDLIFAEAYNEGISPVKHSIQREKITGAELDAELKIAFANGKASNRFGGSTEHIEHKGAIGTRRFSDDATSLPNGHVEPASEKAPASAGMGEK